MASIGHGKSGVGVSGVFSELAALVDNGDHFELMAESDFVIIGVVGRSDFNGAGAVFWIGVFVGDDRDFAVSER